VLLEILVSVDCVGGPVDQAEVESAIANRINKETGPQDLVLFTGPDRLTIIRSGLTAPAETEGFAMRVQGALQQPLLVGEGRVSCQSAIGVAVSRSGDSAERLAQYVEHALGDARMLGGDMMVAFDDQDRDLLAQ
jgi:predicted signal transduction protein with EAL and GGDEF domain